ncbi:terminase small subunit [Gordonia phage Upyo]|nr:terminase small subunit [Gordonia phage Upyo]
MSDENPITHPMTTVLEKSIRSATWLQGTEQYGAAIATARMIAGQIDGVVAASGGVPDPEVLKQLHMRMIPNYHRALFTLGLTPEGYAKMTAAVPTASGGSKVSAAPSSSPGVASPFDAAATATGDALDALIAAETDRTNVIQMGERR